jgi:CheY-like chemotaxis protein
LTNNPLAGLRLLVLEDEFLIAMDVEQLCRDHGAADVVVCKNLQEANAVPGPYDAAIIDLILYNESTLPFAERLRSEGVPFIFASGYTERGDVAEAFPGVSIVGKPYQGDDLIGALADAIRSRSGR